MFDIEEYDYELPEDRVAQVPARRRDGSRLLVVERSERSFTEHHFFDLPGLLVPGDLLVVNNTRVMPARLFGRKASGGKIEVLVIEHPASDNSRPHTRWCLVKSSKRPPRGTRLFFDSNTPAVVEDHGADGLVRITFQGLRSLDAFLKEKGAIPLPPYIKRSRQDDRGALDRERYQTVFSSRNGAVAAPTAGLHFTSDLIQRLREAGVSVVELTLHVGHGTFRPVRTKDIRRHRIGEERYEIDTEAADAITGAKRQGRRVIAVGTTVVRVLETVAGPRGDIPPGEGKTNLLVTPGFRFRAVDGMITNFHLPKSSLLFLVSAFAGVELVRKAYAFAIERGYRFYSYGDGMLIL
jgi:S-adenosylmethionine:tRNA ribosyltransferase-isomerase